MKNAAERLSEIQARIAGLLDEYEWGEAKVSANIWIHEAGDELLDAGEALPENDRYTNRSDITRSQCEAVSPRDRAPLDRPRISMCVFGPHQSIDAEDDAA